MLAVKLGLGFRLRTKMQQHLSVCLLWHLLLLWEGYHMVLMVISQLVFPTIYASLFYWITGLNPLFSRFLVFVLLNILVSICSTSCGILVSAMCSSVAMALAMAPAVMLPLILFGGFFSPGSALPDWCAWLRYASFFYYTFRALMNNEFEGTTFNCDQTPCFRTGEQVMIYSPGLGGGVVSRFETPCRSGPKPHRGGGGGASGRGDGVRTQHIGLRATWGSFSVTYVCGKKFCPNWWRRPCLECCAHFFPCMIDPLHA